MVGAGAERSSKHCNSCLGLWGWQHAEHCAGARGNARPPSFDGRAPRAVHHALQECRPFPAQPRPAPTTQTRYRQARPAQPSPPSTGPGSWTGPACRPPPARLPRPRSAVGARPEPGHGRSAAPTACHLRGTAAWQPQVQVEWYCCGSAGRPAVPCSHPIPGRAGTAAAAPAAVPLCNPHADAWSRVQRRVEQHKTKQ